MKDKENFTKDDIENYLTKQPLWTKFVLQPLFKPLILFFVNRTPWIHPNFITIVSLLFSVIEVYCFGFVAGYKGLFLGALFFELSYFLDCIDGPVARMLNKNSKFGTTLDISADSLRLGGGTLALVLRGIYTSKNEKEILFWGIVLVSCHMGSMWIGYKQLFDSIDSKLNSRSLPGKDNKKENAFLILRPFLWLVQIFTKLSEDDSKNYWLFPTSVELETVVYFILPLFNLPEVAIIVGGIWSLINFISTVVGYTNS